MTTIEKFIEPPLMLHIIEMREYAYTLDMQEQ